MTAGRDYAAGRLLLKRTGGIAALTFNRPERLNAMSLAMWQAPGDLCGHVCPADGFDADRTNHMGRLARNAPLTIRAARAALAELARPEAGRNPGAVNRLVSRCFDSADYAERPRAFSEKRAPVFEGC